MPVLSGKLPLLLHSAREFAMPIRHCIVHLIEKKPDGTPAVLHARDAELGDSQAIENLLADLNESYNAKQGKAWGFFHGESGAYPFSGWLAQYMEGSQDFTAFSRQAVEHLQKLMEESNLSTGGHVLFAHYQQGMTDYLAIALLHHSEGVTVTESLDVAPAKHLDLGQLHLAARINISEWQNNKQSKQYISFIKGKNGKKVSEYFRDFIGCQEGVDAPGETRTLLKAFSDYVESEDLPEEHNRVTLDPVLKDSHGIPAPKIDYTISANSRKMMDHALARGREVLDAAGATDICINDPIPWGGWHLLGTARMGTDPARSVVNEWGRSHDVKNLFIVDGSIFVTSGGVNPTSTIQALALYIADQMKQRLANLFD